MKPHKHAELIKAWADGAEIQIYYEDTNDWKDCSNDRRGFNWYENLEYRIKPESKPEPKKLKAYIYNNINRGISWVDARDPSEFNMGKDWMYMGSIEVTR